LEEREDSVFPQMPNEGSRNQSDETVVRVKVFKQYTKKFKRQQGSVIDPDTCTFTNGKMMRYHLGALFTPDTQCHVGRPVQPLSLFTKTSYSSRLGGLSPDQSSVINPETDLKHRAPMLGVGRWPRDVGPIRTYQ